MSVPLRRGAPSLCLAAFLAGTAGASTPPPETADQFVARANAELLAAGQELAQASWVQLTYITPDTEAMASRANERYLEATSRLVNESKAFAGMKLSPENARAIELLKLGLAAPAPDDPAKRAELSTVSTRLTSLYGAGKWCPEGPDSCRNIDDITRTLAESRDWDTLLAAWQGWHGISPPMRKDYERFVELANEGARGLGYRDLGELWRAGYDMPPADFEKETDRLWNQVKPLYDGLHCYARTKLQQKYGKDRVPDGKPIPAHLLGNIWAQAWNNIYDLLEPYPGVSNLDVTAELQKQGYDAAKMTKSAESFYTSLGFAPLPETFWERSMLVRPRDRDVVCHPSAHSIDGATDVRVKACLQPNEEDLHTVYHELGHVFYDLSYNRLTYLFQDGANDGFHEAIGDTINLSMTEDYLAKVGLIPAGTKSDREALINRQMKVATEKIAFLPFGKLVDQWRWGVFSGAIPPERYNAAWWDLRRKYQGVDAPVPRSEADFDPGAKFHVPDNTPYTRYFLSFVLQFQFHRALCQKAGFKGPLYECSVYGSQEAGEAFAQMLALGRSRPWQDAIEKLTGQREMDASAIIEYFQPLMQWLDEKNRGQACGWS